VAAHRLVVTVFSWRRSRHGRRLLAAAIASWPPSRRCPVSPRPHRLVMTIRP